MSAGDSQIPFEIWRGGTSRAIILEEDHLPSVGEARDAVLSRLVGNRSHLQIDGLGGNHSLTSKVAILRRGESDVDVAFTFAQASVSGGCITYAANCGNISATVVPWAVAHGWISAARARTGAHVLTTSTGTTYQSRLRAGEHQSLSDSVKGGRELSVLMDFLDPGGAQTGALFPTGARVDHVSFAGRTLEVSVVDAGNLGMIVEASEWERATGVPVADLQMGRVTAFEHARVDFAQQLGLAPVGAVPQNTPKLLLVGRGTEDPPWQDAADPASDVWATTLSMGAPHTAFPVTGGVALSAAAAFDGTVLSRLLGERDGRLRVRHPSGVLSLEYALDTTADRLTSVSLERSVRRIAQGTAFAPSPPGAHEEQVATTSEEVGVAHP